MDGNVENIWGYVIEDLAYKIILGDPWMRANNVIYNARKLFIRFGAPSGLVKAKGWDNFLSPAAKQRINICKIKEETARQIQSIHFIALTPSIA